MRKRKIEKITKNGHNINIYPKTDEKVKININRKHQGQFVNVSFPRRVNDDDVWCSDGLLYATHHDGPLQ